jgi:hypothetical protein
VSVYRLIFTVGFGANIRRNALWLLRPTRTQTAN